MLTDRVVVYDLLEEVVIDQTTKDQFVTTKERRGKILFSLQQYEGQD